MTAEVDLQADKDALLERLWARTEIDPETGCFIFTGYWDECGIGRIWFNGASQQVARLAAWIYNADFNLEGDEVVVHYRCQSPACWNFEHIKVVANVDAQLRLACKLKRPTGIRPRLSYEQAEMIRLQATTMTALSLSNEYHVTAPSIRKIINNMAWVRA
jgi:hypothetical protein